MDLEDLTPRGRVIEMKAILAGALRTVEAAIDAWSLLPDVDVASGKLDTARGWLSEVVDELEVAIDQVTA